MAQTSTLRADRRYGPDEVRDLLRRYGVHERVVSRLWRQGVGRAAFLRQDFLELGALTADKLHRLQDKWRDNAENFLNDRPPHHQRAASKLHDFYDRNNMHRRAATAAQVIDNYAHDPASLAASLPKKYPSLASQFTFLKEWRDDCEREARRLSALAKELDIYYDFIDKQVNRHRAIDVIRSYSDDPRCLYEELVANHPEHTQKLEWLLCWAEQVEGCWGAEVELQARVEMEELAKRSDRELRNVRSEMRIVEDQLLDAVEEETARRMQIRKLERQNELLRREMRELTSRPEHLPPLEDVGTQCDLDIPSPSDSTSLHMHSQYGQQTDDVAQAQSTLHQKQRILKQLKEQLKAKRDTITRSKATLLEFDSMVTTQGTPLFDVEPAIEAPPPLERASTAVQMGLHVPQYASVYSGLGSPHERGHTGHPGLGGALEGAAGVHMPTPLADLGYPIGVGGGGGGGGGVMPGAPYVPLAPSNATFGMPPSDISAWESPQYASRPLPQGQL